MATVIKSNKRLSFIQQPDVQWFESRRDQYFLFFIFSFPHHIPCQFQKMYKYVKFDQNIWCGSRVMSIFAKRPWPAKLMFAKLRHHFAYQWLDNVKMNKYAKFDHNIPSSSRVMSWLKRCPANPRASKCQGLDNVDIHFYAKFDQNTPCCSRVMSIFTNWPQRQTNSHSDYSSDSRIMHDCSADQGSCMTHSDYSADPIIVQTQESCNIVQTQGSCNFNLTSKPRVMQYSAAPRVVQF